MFQNPRDLPGILGEVYNLKVINVSRRIILNLSDLAKIYVQVSTWLMGVR